MSKKLLPRSLLVLLAAFAPILITSAAPLGGPTGPITGPITGPRPTIPASPIKPIPLLQVIESRLGFTIVHPLIAFNSGVTGGLTYDPAGTADGGLMVIEGKPLAIQLSPTAAPRLISPFVNNELVSLSIVIDETTGLLAGGIPGDDFLMIGQVDLDGDGTAETAGVLLTGEVLEYEGEDSGTPTDLHFFRLLVTGGEFASLYPADQVGIFVTSENSTFTGDFTVPFEGKAKGTIGEADCTGTIGDFVWLDSNSNGIQDDGEPGIPGVDVVLVNALNETTVTTTDANGFYQFGGLCSGDYTVSVDPATIPPGFNPTLINAPGSTDENDSNDPAGTPVTLPENNGSVQTIDFGYTAEPAGLGDYVWFDTDMDGQQDPDEPPVEGAMVNLYSCSGDFIGTTSTDENGFYSFTNLMPGCYQVEFILPPGFVFSPMDTTADNVDSDPDPTTGLTGQVELGAGEFNPDIDAGMFTPPSAELGDRFWLDLNGNGIQDPNEPGIGGVPVDLVDCETGDVLASTITDPNGMYLFADLDAGCYQVLFTPPDQCVVTQQDQGSDDTDNDADSGGLTGPVFLGPDESNLTVDGGCYYTAGLGDFVWLDANMNGAQDDGEPGIEGLTVVLLDANMVPTGMTTVTGPNGEYEFTGLAPGSYFVQFTAPAGLVFTSQDAVSDDLDSDANSVGKTDKITLESGEFDPTIDAGVFEPPMPAISIEKSTNGEDADNPTGPFVPGGDPVLWEYVVTNTGNTTLMNISVTDDQGVAVNCPLDTLAPGEMMTCTGNGSATVDQYMNLGSVCGTDGTSEVCDDDPSHYFGSDPAIDIEKSTNGQDADTPTGPYITPGSAVTWSYAVTNIGNVELTDVMVIDDQGVTVTCPLDTLSPGQTMTCIGNGTAVAGQYANNSSVTGNPPVGDPVSDEDPSHYFGALPSIDIEKATNGEDADNPTGPFIATGGSVNWTYLVTNTGNVALTNVTVTDSEGVAVSCPQDTLDPGESFTCNGTGIATTGQYFNIGLVTGEPPIGPPVTDDDPSHYFGALPMIDLEKLTQGEDADDPTGPYVQPGSTVTWTYIITNMGNVPLDNIVLNDDQLGPVTCTEGAIPPLDVGDNFICTVMGIAIGGQYVNIGDVCANDPTGVEVCDDDPSHYFGAMPAIDIEKATNGEDADTPTGPFIETGGVVTWTYVVTNTGNVPLANVTVTDDQGVTVSCPADALNPGDSFTCTGTGTAAAGQYANLGSVTGTPPVGPPVTDEDPSHYFGATPSVDIEKLTNGVDADDPNAGDAPQVLPGDVVNWTYIVTNTGNVPLSGIAVTDDQGVAVSCPADTLAPGDSFTCTASGVADDLATTGFTTVPGTCGIRPNQPLYENTGAVVGTTPGGAVVEDSDLSHYCNPEVCALEVSKTCFIPMPVASDYTCDKPIDSLTMIWDGATPVRIKAWKGPVGSELLADINDIQPGEEITVMGYAGSPNDVFWEVFDSGTDNKIGESKFHLSCSDSEMNGPEDCGLNQGNGKDNDGGLVNNWLLEGIVDAGGTLDCTQPPATGANQCEFQAFPASCETGNADLLTFQYSGGGCGASANSQQDHVCTGTVDGGASATFTDDDGNSVTLAPGETVTIPRNLAKNMTLTNAGGTESNLLHTSCSQPIAAGDVYGSLTLVQIDGMGIGTNVEYAYVITNTSNVDIDSLTAVDVPLGPIPGAPASLGAGQSVTLNTSAFITDTTTNVAIVDGVTADGQMCNGTAEATVTILPPPPCEVSGEGEFDHFHSDHIYWKLTNNGAFTATIESIEVSWPADNGALESVQFSGTIFSGSALPTSATLDADDWVGDAADRQFSPGDTKTLKLNFGNSIVGSPGDYQITVNFEEGCSITFANTGRPFECNTDITELTMIWDGAAQPIDIKAWKGDVGSDLLLDQTGIAAGDEVTVSGYGNQPNDVVWEIFSGGSKLGESVFHMSCSDNDMNGAEDCGKRQGNGKGNDADRVNDWLLEGMVDQDGPFDCSALP
ncbi:MAG: hypothetical protein HKN49_04525 [Gammaproteobacteria bacterium]|nr:hypothetical protein [Gammaproteobacteria bacterium]